MKREADDILESMRRIVDVERRLRAEEAERRARMTDHERAAAEVADLLAAGVPVLVDQAFTPGQVTVIDVEDALWWRWGQLPPELRASLSLVGPTRLLGFHSEEERDRFFDNLNRNGTAT